MLGWVLGECGEFERRPLPCPIDIGLELLDLLKARAPTAPIAPGAGLADLDFLGVPGVPGGVTPLPFALLAPMTLTSSLTETPCSSGGISLLNGIAFLCASAGDAFLLGTGGLDDPLGLLPGSSPLNHFWKKDFLSIEPALPLAKVGELGFGVLLIAPAPKATPAQTPAPTATPPTTPPANAGKLCLGGVDGLTGLGRLFLLEKGRAVVSKPLGDMETSGEGENMDAPACDCDGKAGTPGAQTLFSAFDIPKGDT